MNHRNPLRLALLAGLASSLAACNSVPAPVAPGSQMAASGAPALAADPATVLLSAGTLHLDLDAGLATLVPDRQALAIGDTYSELGLAPAFNGDFGQNFRVIGLRRTGPTSIEVTFETKHPFSPSLRPDLAIFNLKAWIVSSQNAVNLNGVDIAPGLVSNATGYGRMWTDTALSQPGFPYATVQPYVMLNEDRSNAPFDWQQPAGWNVFFPGMVSEDAVELELGTATQLSLRVYLTADYGQSAVRATRQSPEYSLPQFAGNAPWRIEVTELSNDLEEGAPASSASYRVDIWDWKHGSGLGSDVALATLQIPGVTAAPSTLTLTGSGQDADPLTASTLILNGLGAAEGDYWGLVEVTDQSTSGTGLLEDLRTPVAISQYRTWQVFRASVSAPVIPDVPPTAAFAQCNPVPLRVGIGEYFDASGSTPGTHPITAYEWDQSYDGITFDVDASGENVILTWPALGSYTLALRVSDGFGNSDIATGIINVASNPAWLPGVRLTTNAIYENIMGSQVETGRAGAITADGHAHLIYPEVTGTFPNYTFEHWHQEFGGCPTQVFPRKLISSTANNSNSQWNCSAAAVGDVLHAAFTGPIATGGYPEFRHAKYENGTWTVLGPITEYPGSSLFYSGGHLASLPDGTLGFTSKRVMLPAACPGVPAPPQPVNFKRYIAGVWEPQQQIGTRNNILATGGSCSTFTHYEGDLQLLGMQNNEWMAVWSHVAQQYDGVNSLVASYTVNIKMNRTTGGTWGSDSTIFTTVSQRAHPTLAQAPNGTVWLASGIGSQSSIAMAQYNGASWTPLTTIQTIATGSSAYFQLAFDPMGRGMIIYSHNQPSTYINSKLFNQTDSLAAVAAVVPVAVEPGNFQRLQHQLGGLPTGGFIAAWVTDKYGGGPFAAREIDATVWQ